MATEIERKFLVHDSGFLELAEYSRDIKQGYLTGLTENGASFRVRIANEQAFLTVKGKNCGISRAEFEYQIPLEDAEEMFAVCGSRIVEKTRYYLHYAGNLWEVDVFKGRHSGLVVAEIELPDENAVFEKPPFAAEEVTGDFKYSNLSLALS